MAKSKRFNMAMIVAAILAAIGLIGFMVHPEHLGELGTFLGLTVMPIIAVYLLGETARPSGTMFKQTKQANEK